jgi:hypothetical protein
MKALALVERPGSAERRLVTAAVVSGALIIAALAACPARAEEISDIPGAFADVGIGAAEMGTGGAAVATAHGASAIHWNPAGLALTDRQREFEIGYCDQMGLVPYSTAAGVFRLGDDYAVGAGILHAGDDVLTEVTALVGLARTFPGPPWAPDERLSVGATVRTRWASFGDNESTEGQVTGSALGFALDVGAVVPLPGPAAAGLSVQDVAGVLNWDSSARGSYEEGVPSDLVGGVAYRPWERLTIEVDLEKALRLDRHDAVLAGAELRVFEVASLRTGYRRALRPGELEEFSFGAGATVTAGTTAITVDVAYLIGHVENTLRFGVGFGM